MSSETMEQYRARVAAEVANRFPEALPPNRFVNALLDIVRGGHGFGPRDRLEAVDTLAERHLPASLGWGKGVPHKSYMVTEIWRGAMHVAPMRLFTGEGAEARARTYAATLYAVHKLPRFVRMYELSESAEPVLVKL